MSNTWLVIIIAVLCLGVGAFVTHTYIDKPVVVTNTTTVFRDTGKTKPGELKIIKVQKPVSITQLDSIYAKAKQETKPDTIMSKPVYGLFSLSKDTNFVNADSTVRLQAHREVRSQLPFYKAQFYDSYEITSKPKTIITNIYSPSLFDKFNYNLGLHAGYDLITGKPCISVGINAGFDIGRIF